MKSFFISSTFKDMQAERDVIHQNIFPYIRKKLKDYGEDIQELDLRWGVDTSLISEEENGHYIIGSCIDAIDHCRPYMIVLVGDRYGWIPDFENVKSINDERVTKWYNEPISITQMEILYGAFEQDNFARCIFCFRDNSFVDNMPENKRSIYQVESTEHQEKLTKLKEKIRATENAIIFDYKPVWNEQTGHLGGLEAFSEQLTTLLWKMLQKEIGEKRAITTEERILNNAVFTASRYVSTYVQRAKLDDGHYFSGRSGVWFYGDGGCGKSAFLSNLYNGAKKVGTHAFIYFCGNEDCGNVDALLDTLLFWLRKEHGEAASGQVLTKKQKFEAILELVNRERKWDSAILIDGVDQMEEDCIEILGALQRAVTRDKVGEYTFSFIVTSTTDYYRANAKKIDLFDFSGRIIGELLPTEVIALTQATAKRRGKHLDARTQNVIRQKKGSGNPYYLSLLLQQLFMMDEEDFKKADMMGGGMEGLAAFMEKLISEMPENVMDMTVAMLEEAVKKLGHSFERLEKSMEMAEPMLIFKLLAVSRSGLSLRELEKLLQKKGKTLLPMAVQRLFNYLYDTFGESRDGRWDYTHRLLRESLLKQMSEEEYKELNLLICQVLQEEEKYAESFYYALAAQNKEAAKQCMDAVKDCDEKSLQAYLQSYNNYLFHHMEEKILMTEIPARRCGWFLVSLILSDIDQALKNQEYWLQVLAELKNAPKIEEKTLFRIVYAELALNKYERESEYVKYWEELSALYFAMENPDEAEQKAYFSTFLTIMSAQRYQKDLKKIAERYARIKERTELYEKLQEVIRLWETGGSLEEIQKRIDVLHDGLQASDTEEYRNMVYGQYIQLIEEYRGKKDNQSAYQILQKITPEYEQKIGLFPSLDERVQYARLLENWTKCLTPTYGIKYIEKLEEQCALLVEKYPFKFFKIELAYAYFLEAYKLEEIVSESKSKDKKDAEGWLKEEENEKKIPIAYQKAIDLYEEVLGENREDEKNNSVLDFVCYLRYRRIRNRRNGDIWKWSAERSSTSRIPISAFEKKMEDDIERLAEDTITLYKQEKRMSRLNELAWTYMDGVLYFDCHQEEEKMYKYSRLMLECDREMTEKWPERSNWEHIPFYIAAAEAHERFGRYKEAKMLAEQGLEFLKSLDPEWLEKKSAKRDMVRFYLVLMKCLSDDLDKVQHYHKLAWKIADTTLTKKTDDVWKSDLRQTLAEAYHKAGRDMEAAMLLESTTAYWKEIDLIWFDKSEIDTQQKVRFLNGQSLLGRIQKDAKLLEKVTKRYKELVAYHMPDKDASRRPLLLKQVQQLEEFYKKELPDTPIPESLQYVLLKDEAGRNRQKWEKALVEEQKRLQSVEIWEKVMGDLKEPHYLNLLNKVVEIQDKMGDYVRKDSQEYLEVYIRKIGVVRKMLAHYWSVGNEKKALGYEYFIYGQFEVRKEVMESLISAEESWNNWCFLKEKRNSSDYISRTREAQWASLFEGAMQICYRYYEETKDAKWLWQAVKEAIEYRAYLMNRLSVKEDKDWVAETIVKVLSYEQEVYLKMQKEKCMEEEKWLVPFLESIKEQLKIEKLGSMIPESAYRKKLEKLYYLLGLNLKDTTEIQKLINVITEKQGTEDQSIAIYMQKAIRELGENAELSEIQAYAMKLKNGI